MLENWPIVEWDSEVARLSNDVLLYRVGEKAREFPLHSLLIEFMQFNINILSLHSLQVHINVQGMETQGEWN